MRVLLTPSLISPFAVTPVDIPIIVSPIILMPFTVPKAVNELTHGSLGLVSHGSESDMIFFPRLRVKIKKSIGAFTLEKTEGKLRAKLS